MQFRAQWIDYHAEAALLIEEEEQEQRRQNSQHDEQQQQQQQSQAPRPVIWTLNDKADTDTLPPLNPSNIMEENASSSSVEEVNSNNMNDRRGEASSSKNHPTTEVCIVRFFLLSLELLSRLSFCSLLGHR